MLGVRGDAGELLASQFTFGLEPVIDGAAPIPPIQIFRVRKGRDLFVTNRQWRRVGADGLTPEG